jgi:hypothetical protein
MVQVSLNGGDNQGERRALTWKNCGYSEVAVDARGCVVGAAIGLKMI